MSPGEPPEVREALHLLHNQEQTELVVPLVPHQVVDHLARGDPHMSDSVLAEAEYEGQDDGLEGLGREEPGKGVDLLRQNLADPPFLGVVLELGVDVGQSLALL